MTVVIRLAPIGLAELQILILSDLDARDSAVPFLSSACIPMISG
jgi:hypothetical protein